MDRKVRIGIDVGGTFTDAVVIDNQTYEVIAKEKVPTTHHAPNGVAQGIVEAIHMVLEKNHIKPEDVIFIAHGTTQATNALLEGDVAKVGIIGMGSGAEGIRAKKETTIGNISLTQTKYLYTKQYYVDSAKATDEEIRKDIQQLKQEGAEVIVASEAYSVDDPSNEKKVIQIAHEENILATGGYEISQLYGLQSRTRTAVVNAALIPKMMETATMTETAVKDSGISRPLMIMRCDGGVMSVEEVRKRPILTMLSGLAAGVAGALMYEKITDGIFLEIGGTSTDISAIKDGKVMIKNAQVGGHKLYLTSLDVRTLGVAGGSMIVIENNHIVDVGPRSAHIAEMEYEVFTTPEHIVAPELHLIAPRKDDKANYAIVSSKTGSSYALTLAGAANILGYVPSGDYAFGNRDAAILAWQALADMLGLSIEEACTQVMDLATKKIQEIVESLIQDYELNKNLIYLVGGGGSAAVVTPYLSKKMNIRQRIAKNAPYISTIGVALALVREQLERNITNPTEEDIRKIRSEILEVITKAGANPETVEISIEIENQKNILRAIATGATELRTKELNAQTKTEEELQHILEEAVQTTSANLEKIGQTGRWYAYRVTKLQKCFFGLWKKKMQLIRVIDNEGIVRLQKNHAQIKVFKKKQIRTMLEEFIDGMTQYTDAGATLPKTYLYFKQKAIDLSGVINKEQLFSLIEMELEFLEDTNDIIVVVAKD